MVFPSEFQTCSLGLRYETNTVLLQIIIHKLRLLSIKIKSPSTVPREKPHKMIKNPVPIPLCGIKDMHRYTTDKIKRGIHRVTIRPDCKLTSGLVSGFTPMNAVEEKFGGNSENLTYS
ncbi:hypothetical protein AVEN_247347-1 [Araneus ventricosus]|uniref:Uncharacterized protein n=1 Tax=Araneus ventricosus TaxID=182803 RepID=A0A4Y2P327_ARAVE|nr:hypothetical protein AVEN_247347-1 [Araneus ventricosus]